MELDRQTIEKKDFPIGRRGYEPEAVDAHLRELADEVDGLRRAARPQRGESLASAASAQVQAIVEAAETTAADIERQAQMEGQRIRQEAERGAERTREEAIERAQGHVQAVSQATSIMLQRIDAMESELGALVESLRTGANRLTADLTLLEGNMSELYDAAGRGAGAPIAPAAAEPAVEAMAEPAAEPTAEEQDLAEEAVLLVEAEAELEAEQEALLDAPEEGLAGPPSFAAEPEEVPETELVAEPEIEVTPEPELEVTPEPEPEEGASADVDGARLIALNMALNGQSREEADRYLAENFDLPDRSGLLDEVYAAVEG